MDVTLCSIMENNAGNRFVIVDETNANSASRVKANRIQMLRGPGNSRRGWTSNVVWIGLRRDVTQRRSICCPTGFYTIAKSSIW